MYESKGPHFNTSTTRARITASRYFKGYKITTKKGEGRTVTDNMQVAINEQSEKGEKKTLFQLQKPLDAT